MSLTSPCRDSATSWAVPHDCPLKPVELRVLEHLAQGMTYGEIALSLGRSTSTIRSHLHNAHTRLGVSSSYQALLACVRAGWLPWDPSDPEERQLMRIEQLLRQLLDASHTRRKLEALTPTQRRYLDALDDHLREPAGWRLELRTREEVDRALAAMLAEAGVPSRRHGRDLVQLLGAFIDGEAQLATRAGTPPERPDHAATRPIAV